MCNTKKLHCAAQEKTKLNIYIILMNIEQIKCARSSTNYHATHNSKPPVQVRFSNYNYFPWYSKHIRLHFTHYSYTSFSSFHLLFCVWFSLWLISCAKCDSIKHKLLQTKEHISLESFTHLRPANYERQSSYFDVIPVWVPWWWRVQYRRDEWRINSTEQLSCYGMNFVQRAKMLSPSDAKQKFPLIYRGWRLILIRFMHEYSSAKFEDE